MHRPPSHTKHCCGELLLIVDHGVHGVDGDGRDDDDDGDGRDGGDDRPPSHAKRCRPP